MAPYIKIASLALLSTAFAAPSKRAVNPTVNGDPKVLGLVTNPSVNRDSCGSTRFQGRDFWTCRDTQNNDDNGLPTLQVTSSTAAWTAINDDGSPKVETFLDGSQGVLMTGDNGPDNRNVYFPLASDQCNDNTAGSCSDGTRYAIWPDSPPMITSGADSGTITAYTWILNQKIKPDFSTDTPDPSVTLYKMTYDPNNGDENAFPSVQTIDEHFWEQDAIAYGAYGNVVRDDTAYLYGKTSGGVIALAKVPVGSVEDKSQYQYWVNGAWTNTAPAKDDSTANIDNASAGAQGTYYYSDSWQSYVWIGQASVSVSADFHITTAPDPTGPWEEPKVFYSGENGSADLSAYTLQAHPGMVPDGKNQIYLTYTKTDTVDGTDLDVYSTPLILVEWQ